MDRTERLLNLVLCLLSASVPVDRETIRRIVAGYDTSASDAAFERMFERDKDELRSMGIPLETVTTSEGEVLGYRILRDDYRLPAIEATAEQWALLGLAGRAWSQASIGREARSALRKLEGVSVQAPQHAFGEIIEWHSRPEAGEQWLATLWNAIRQRQTITFDYLGLRDDVPHTRQVQPWRVLGRDGGWYLIGHDQERQAPRSFRLSRITGDIAVAGSPGAYVIPPHDAEQIMHNDRAGGDRIPVWLAVEPGSGGRIRMSAGPTTAPPDGIAAHAPSGFDILRVETADTQSLVIDVAELGEKARILHPERLHDAVVARWESVLSAHVPSDDDAPIPDEPDVVTSTGPVAKRSSSPATAERLSRLLALVPWLTQHPGVTIAEAADHFGVTAEQLETDLWLVICCGLPGHGPDQLIDIQFWDDDGRIDVIDPQSLVAPTQLTIDEAVSLQVGLSILAGIAGPDDAGLIRQTMDLLNQATGGLEVAAVDAVSTEVDADEQTRSVILTACENASAVRIEYYTATRDIVSTRIVWPRRLVVGSGGRLLVEAWCTQARDARTFRVDRILSARDVPADEAAAWRSGTPGEVAPESAVAPIEVQLKVGPSARWMLDAHDLEILSWGPHTGATARLVVHDPRWLVRLVLGLGGDVVVTSPPEYRAMVVHAAQQALAVRSDGAKSGRVADHQDPTGASG